MEAGTDLWNKLLRIVHDNKGRVPFFVDLEHDGVLLRTRVNNGTLVAPTDRLAEQLEDLVGAGSVKFGLRENNNGNRNVPHWKRKKRK